MSEGTMLLERVRKALTSVPQIDVHRHHVDLAIEHGALVMAGELPSVAAKKLALEAAAAVAPNVENIIDRLRVIPAERQGDREIRDHLCDALVGEPALADVAIYVDDKGQRHPMRVSEPARGEIDIRVADGVVTLDGQVSGLERKRLAGLLAWWVPGSRDVVNGLAVEPPEEDSDEEIAEAVRLALEKDPFVNAGQIRIGVRNAVVTLAGLVPAESERTMAENDAWCIFGVNRVVNHIEVRP
jgi:osmotically-inducible protein OsmY